MGAARDMISYDVTKLDSNYTPAGRRNPIMIDPCHRIDCQNVLQYLDSSLL